MMRMGMLALVALQCGVAVVKLKIRPCKVARGMPPSLAAGVGGIRWRVCALRTELIFDFIMWD